MPSAAFTTLGCKVNQYETQNILDQFEARGFEIRPFNATADIYVINTCSVTQAAERKSRYMIRKLSRQNPDAVVVVTGCYGEMSKIKEEPIEEATLLVPNPEKLKTLQHLMAAHPRFEEELLKDPRKPGQPERRTRATIKVQDGCNVFCSFCSIPYTRKVMLSRTSSEVLEEVKKRADQGYREIVITGVLVGAYGPDTGSEGDYLGDLLVKIADVAGIERVRLSSIEPTQVTDQLLQAFASNPRLCNHLHIPLQSGDSGVLRGMNRPYDQQFYLDRCAVAKSLLPNLAITSDIMVGFPGEDEAAFQNTLAVAKEVEFARAHIFRYSSRPGTPAADRKDVVPETVKEERSLELANVCNATQSSYIQRYLGRTMKVLVEGKNREGGLLNGYTENYIKTFFTGGSDLVGQVISVRLQETTQDGAVGEALNSYQPEADIIPLTLVTGLVTSS